MSSPIRSERLPCDAYKKYADLAFEYHIAAVMLWETIIDCPYLYNPFMFLSRHTIELLLKGIIMRYCSEEERHMITVNNKLKPIDSIHALSSLWNHYVLNGRDNQQSLFQEEEEKRIADTITWIEKKDFSSTYYRYPFKHDGTRLKIEPITISKNALVSPALGQKAVYIAEDMERVDIIKTGAEELRRGASILESIEMLFGIIEAP